jgi:hypothetical protein
MSTETRIESLEHQVRALKQMLFGVFALLVVGGLLAATTLHSVPDVIQAKKFEVVDQHGQSKAVLGLGPFGDVKSSQPYIAFKGEDGKPLAGMGVFPGGGGLALSRPDGSDYAAIANFGQDGSAFFMVNKNGKKTITLAAQESAGGSLDLRRPDGSIYYAVVGLEDGDALISLSSKKDGSKAMLAMKDGQPVIGCLDSKGDMAVEITVSESRASVSCLGPGGTLRGSAMLGSGNSLFGGGVLVLANNELQMKTLVSPPGLTEEDKKLLEACSKDGASVSAIQKIIQSGADVNRPWFKLSDEANGIDTNFTALMLAAKNQSDPAVLSALLKAGADANATSSNGKKALAFAKANKKLKGTRAIEELEIAMKRK